MEHKMKIQSEPFNKICSGTKKIEIRLFDKKRQQLKIGDTIIFSKMDDASIQIKSKIVDLIRFDTFKELCREYDPKLYGSLNQNQYKGMYKYYSREDEQRYGVLAIHLQVLSGN